MSNKFEYLELMLDQSSRALNFASYQDLGHSKRQFINSHRFEAEYWTRIPQKLKAGLSPRLVFAEIQGIIKGSATKGDPTEHLSREEYLARSQKSAPLFSEQLDRSRVYDIYEVYETWRFKDQAEDSVDRVAKVLKAVRSCRSLRRLLGRVFHDVYIDGTSSQPLVDDD